MLLETFCKDRTHSPFTGIHKIIPNTLRSMGGNSCDQHNSKTNNSRKTRLGILNGHNKGMLLETFCKDRTHSPYTGIHKIIQIHDGLWEEFLASTF